MPMGKDSLNIVFVGSVINKQDLKFFSDASIAGNKMQLGFITGFQQNGVQVQVISVEPQKMWRFNKKPILIRHKNFFIENCHLDTIAYINLPVLKQFFLLINIYRTLNNYSFNKNTVIVVYNTMSFFALPVLKISKTKKCKNIAIVADLPIKKNKNIFRKFEDYLQEKLISKFDGLIPLTVNIAKDFAPTKPYCLVEAGFNPDDYINLTEICVRKHDSNKIWNIVFSGTLNELSGIELLISAMDLIKDKKIILNVYGDGELKSTVINASKKNDRICYHGKVGNDKMMIIQANSDLLICPRCSDNYTTKYTFPSKILEYMCVGVPVICNPLSGIPKEYDKYLCYCKSETREEWANTILNILGENYAMYKKNALEAKNNFIKEKTWNAQCKKVVKFLEDTFR